MIKLLIKSEAQNEMLPRYKLFPNVTAAFLISRSTFSSERDENGIVLIILDSLEIVFKSLLILFHFTGIISITIIHQTEVVPIYSRTKFKFPQRLRKIMKFFLSFDHISLKTFSLYRYFLL